MIAGDSSSQGQAPKSRDRKERNQIIHTFCKHDDKYEDYSFKQDCSLSHNYRETQPVNTFLHVLN